MNFQASIRAPKQLSLSTIYKKRNFIIFATIMHQVPQRKLSESH